MGTKEKLLQFQGLRAVAFYAIYNLRYMAFGKERWYYYQAVTK